MAFIHPRTGRSWANEAMAIQMDGPLVSPAPIGPGQTGTLVQTGEFAGNTAGWIEPLQVNYQATGPMSVNDWVRSDPINTSPTNYGTATNPAQGLKAAQDAWDSVLQENPGAGNWSTSDGSMAEWNSYFRSVSGPIGAANILVTQMDTPMPTLQQAITDLLGKTTVNSPSNSPGSTNNAGTGTGGQAKVTTAGGGSTTITGTPDSTTTTGGGATGGSGLGGITDTLGTYGIYILGGFIAIVFVILMVGRGSGSSQGVRS